MAKTELKLLNVAEEGGGEGKKSLTNIAMRGLMSRPKSSTVGTLPRFPLGELTTLPQKPWLSREGIPLPIPTDSQRFDLDAHA